MHRRVLSALELKIPPVALTLLTALLMWLLARAGPVLDIAEGWRAVAMAALVLAGGAVGMAGVRSFRIAGTTVNPFDPNASSQLVTTGIYRYSRNPMYLGLLLALLGWAAWLASPFALALALGFVPYMNRFQIGPEERTLALAFGEAFERYRKDARRWL